jgi:hypothetical protein
MSTKADQDNVLFATMWGGLALFWILVILAILWAIS